MASKAIHEMISSFAAGCMDKKNFEQFKEYIQSEGELPPGELGELQNVISLLPVILELEKPDKKLKDKLAKKLIGMQDEIKEKIRLTQQRTASKTRTVNRLTEEELNLARETGTHQDIQASETAAPKREYDRDDFYEMAKRANEPPTLTRSYELPPRSQKDLINKADKKNYSILWGVLIALLAVIITVAGFVYFSSSDYENEIASLQNRIDNLESQLNTANQFMREYNSLIEFINYEDVQVVNLSSASEDINASGKLLLSLKHRSGLLEFNNMPPLNADQAFQVWFINNGRSYSIGTYIPRRNVKYITIPELPSLPQDQIDLVRVTIEPVTGSEIPEGPAVLFGALNDNTR